MFKNSILGTILGLFVLSGCGYKESIVQNNNDAYLEFTRNSYEKLTVYVNDSSQITLEQCESQENCNNNVRYGVPSGTVLIRVFNTSNKQIHQEQLYLGVGNTKKVVLP